MNSSELYVQARKARRNRDTDKAAKRFQVLIEQYPDSQEAKYARGQLQDVLQSNKPQISQAPGRYKHKTMDWKNTSIRTGKIRPFRASCLVLSDRLTVKPRYFGTRVIADRFSRQITMCFSFHGIGLFPSTQIRFDDVEDVYGLYEEFHSLVTYGMEKRGIREYTVMIKTKHGTSIRIARGVSKNPPLYNKDSTWDAEMLESELRKMIFMP